MSEPQKSWSFENWPVVRDFRRAQVEGVDDLRAGAGWSGP